MSKKLEKDWKSALTSIIQELDASQYDLMLESLQKIPKGRRTDREKMPQIIIEHYGAEKSISSIAEAMDEIPRRDSAVQDLLRPFLEKLRNKGSRCEQGQVFKTWFSRKRKHESDSEPEDVDDQPETGFRKNNIVSDSESSDEEQKAAADPPQKTSSDTQENIPPWRKTINALKLSGVLDKKLIRGKVVQKSGLRKYRTKTKVTKFFFYLGVADETASIKVMVYGKERYQQIKEGSTCLFRDVIMDESLMKVTKLSKISKTSPAHIPEELELQAQMLIYQQWPVYSIEEAKMSEDKTMLSVEGTVKDIGPVKGVNLKKQPKKKERRDFRLEDGTDSIRISMWGGDIMQLRGISSGDSVRVTNVKTNCYYDTVSLNSTDFTRIHKVQSAPVHNVTMDIIGITKANKMKAELEAELGSNVHTFVVASSLLAKAFGVKLADDFEENLFEKIPFRAQAQIQGSPLVLQAA
ncbi:hypothetical protein Q5P01_018990 [Channa striata]|uniref:Pyrin domain-containing protein n=1 Tax=Channa striata TaxID=64152 RepID=A0AA88M0M5_CHASR|nr:hypothetical protein Q5P01_018990 [Channa striata]